jgi:signal transduction histidine kinase
MDAVIKSFALLSRSNIVPARIELTGLINEAYASTVPTNIGFTLDNPIATGLCVAGDRGLLLLVFGNLFRNSVEAGARRVRIDAKIRRGSIIVEYRDDGPGLNPAFNAQLFEPFYSSKGQPGLGMFLVKKILLLHEGDIEALAGGPGAGFRLMIREAR